MGITFRKIESFNQIPVLPEVLHIRGPKIQSKRPGGIGLDDIKDFIIGDVEFLTANQVSEMDREERTIDFRIQRAGMCDLCFLRPFGAFELTNERQSVFFTFSPPSISHAQIQAKGHRLENAPMGWISSDETN